VQIKYTDKVVVTEKSVFVGVSFSRSPTFAVTVFHHFHGHCDHIRVVSMWNSIIL